MKMCHGIFLTIISLCIPFYGFAVDKNQILKEKMIGDLEIIKNSFEVRYAPAEWKKTFAGWDLNEQIDLAKSKILSKENITVKEFQRIVNEFFKSTCDYHVGVRFFSTEAAFLPFRIQGINGKYFIVGVDTDFAPVPSGQKGQPVTWHLGDEIISFNGKNVHDVVTELKLREMGSIDSATNQGFAEIFLTTRVASLGQVVPKGSVTVTIKHIGKPSPLTYQLNWLYSPEKIQYHFQTSIPSKNDDIDQKISEHPFFKKEMTAAFYAPLQAALKAKKSAQASKANEEETEKGRSMGSKNGILPSLGTVIWKNDSESRFQAYLYSTDNQKIVGYVRIPNYDCGGKDAAEFCEIIKLFEETTEALVIDQMNNPGGILFYMYALATMLTDKPLALPTSRQTITQEDVASALAILPELKDIVDFHNIEEIRNIFGTDLFGYPISRKLVKSLISHFEFIIDEWNQGRTFTNPDYMYGISTLDPHPTISYTKPILLLVNNMDFSCGDFFPAILQDNKRVTVFGSRTAGAGGFILQHSYPNLFGIGTYSFTGSIAERLDKTPIENLGVIPDISYNITENDLKNNYEDYVEAVEKAVQKLLSPTKKKQKK